MITLGYIERGLEFKYSNRIEMNNEDRIKLYGLITDKYEVTADEIEKEFGIHVGRQLNAAQMMVSTGDGGSSYGGESSTNRHVMSDEEYYRRYGRTRGSRVANFLRDAE